MSAAPLPPCPLTAEVLEPRRKIPEGSLPILSRPVDLETVIGLRAARSPVRRWATMDSLGNCTKMAYTHSWCFSRKKSTPIFVESSRLSALGAIASSIPKKRAALLVTKFRQSPASVPNIQSFSRSWTSDWAMIVDDRIFDYAQEAFRQGRSTKRQLAKMHSTLHHQGRRRTVCL